LAVVFFGIFSLLATMQSGPYMLRWCGLESDIVGYERSFYNYVGLPPQLASRRVPPPQKKKMQATTKLSINLIISYWSLPLRLDFFVKLNKWSSTIIFTHS